MFPIFPTNFTYLLNHSDGSTLDIKISPRNLFWLSVSPNSISLYSYKNNKFLAKYALTNEQIQKFGFFTQSTWVSDNHFALLLSEGFVFLFSLTESFIRLENIFDSDPSSTRLSITSLNEYVVCTDDNGFLLFFCTDYQKGQNIKIQITNFPIKRIYFTSLFKNQQYGVILSADGRSFSFEINLSMIHQGTSQFILKPMTDSRVISVALSKRNIAASFKVNNMISIVDVSSINDPIDLKAKFASRAILCFADDMTLFIIYMNGTLSVWNYMQRITHTFKFPDLINCHCASISGQYLYASNETGIFVLPIFSLYYSEFPLLLGPSTVVEFRAVKNGAVHLDYDLSQYDESICSVSVDELETFVAVGLESKIVLIDRSTSSIIENDKLKMITKYIQFSGQYLCVIEIDSLHYFLRFISIDSYDVLSNIEIQLPPVGLSTDSRTCIVLFDKGLSVFENMKFVQTIELDSTPIHCSICSIEKKIIVLLQSRQLLLISYGEKMSLTIIASNVSQFFYDNNFSLIFIFQGIRVEFCSLSNLKPIPFCECADTAIGIISSCSAILFLSTNTFTPIINYFFDYSIVSEMNNPNNAANTMLPMKQSSFFPNLLRQISVFALREKMGKNLVIFLSHFPEHLKFCIASALRAVESPERKGVIESLGKVSTIFAKFAGLSIDMNRSGIVMFHEHLDVPESDTINAALLLPVLMEEEGPNIAFPATFYILKKLHYEIDFIESLFRFLDPLVAPATQEPDGRINATGMIMESKDYYELKKRLNETIDFCMIDLLLKFMPHLIIPFAYSAQLQVQPFFKQHKTMDAKSNLVTVLSRIAPLLTKGKATKQEFKQFADQTLQEGWTVWPIALYIISGETDKAKRLLNKNRNLMKDLSQSQYMNLL